MWKRLILIVDGWWYLFLQVWSTKNDTTTIWFGLFGWSCDVYSVLVSQGVILEKLKRLLTKTDTNNNVKFLKTIFFHVPRLMMCRWVIAVSVYKSISWLGSPCPSFVGRLQTYFLNPSLTLVRFMQIPSALWLTGSLLEGTPLES